MEITVISEDDNPMLHRTDVRFRVSHAEATPDRLAVRDSLAARLNKDANEVVIRRLDTKFGMRETVGEAKVYQGADFAADVEQRHMLVRNKIGDAAEEVAESAEDTDAEADEAPAEEAEAEEAEDAGSEPAPEDEEPAADDAPDDEEVEADEGADEDEETAADAEDADAEADDEPDAEADEGADEDEETEE